MVLEYTMKKYLMSTYHPSCMVFSWVLVHSWFIPGQVRIFDKLVVMGGKALCKTTIFAIEGETETKL
jgi:hypothetical protein